MVKISSGEVALKCTVCDKTIKSKMLARLHNKYCPCKLDWDAGVREANNKLGGVSVPSFMKRRKCTIAVATSMQG